MTNGIFNHIPFNFRQEVSKDTLDVMFIASFGKRNPSPILETIQETYGEKLDDFKLTTLGLLIACTYSEKWEKLGAIYDLEYDPIHNYLDDWSDNQNTEESSNTSESTSDSLTKGTSVIKDLTRTDDLEDKIEYGRKTTRTDDLLQHETGTESSEGTGSNRNSVYAFNSGNTPSDADENNSSSTSDNSTENDIANSGTQDIELSGADTRKNTGTQTVYETLENTGTDRRSVTKESEGGSTGERTRTGRHFGNIGNITTQKQILEEINIWKWNYVNAVLDDVKEFLTLPVYLTHLQWYEEDETNG